MSNDRDQDIVKSAIADTGSGLLEFLSALGQREAIAFGDGVSLPVRIKFDELPKHCMPRSSTARFTEKWQKSVGDEGYLEGIVDRWRSSSSTASVESMAMFAEAMNLSQGTGPDIGQQPRDANSQRSNGNYAAQPPFGLGDGARTNGTRRREDATPSRAVPSPQQPANGDALRSIRERLQQR